MDGHEEEIEALRVHFPSYPQIPTDHTQFQYISLARYCQNAYRTRKPLVDALKKTKQDLTMMQNRAAEETSKVVALQRDNSSLRAAAQQVSEVETLRAEVQRLRNLEQSQDQFYADVEAFHLLKADMRDLNVFRKNKVAILRYLKLLPKIIE